MHSKIKGGIGVAETCSFFLKHEIPCFGELFCDLSEVDLIIEVNEKLKTVQVRSVTSENETARLSLRSITPGTRKSPCKVKRLKKNIDLFVLYVLDRSTLLFIDGQEVKDLNNMALFRFGAAKNNQQCGCRMAQKYLLPSFLQKH